MTKFNRFFFFYFALLFTLAYGLVVAVDPYDKLGINLFGFKTKAVASSRDNKFYMLESSKIPYEAFIIGSSTAHKYHTEDLERLTGLKTFNYAVQHTTPEDYVAIINHIKSKLKPKLIVLQIAFVDLDKNYETDKILYSSPLKDFLGAENKNTYVKADIFSNNYITLDALRDTFRVIFINLFGEIRHQYLEHGNYIPQKDGTGPIEVIQFSHHNWKLDENRVQLLKKIQEECRATGIKLVVISAPLSIDHYNKIMADSHMRDSFLLYKKTANEVFDFFHDFTTDKVKDFNTKEFFGNSTHPTRKYSKIILEEIWSQK
jgi:hypothetical protein